MPPAVNVGVFCALYLWAGLCTCVCTCVCDIAESMSKLLARPRAAVHRSCNGPN
jgi:hypothetical protein